MLTTAILALILATEPAPAIGATETTHACQSPSVERPELAMPAPEWAFVLPPERCEPSRGAAVTMYAMGIDAAEPVQGEEYTGDIYENEEP